MAALPLLLAFTVGAAEVTQEGRDMDCGFGANVNASGRYVLKPGQRCHVHPDVWDGDGALQIVSPQGRIVRTVKPGGTWTGRLLHTGAYRLRIRRGREIALYSIEVEKLPAK